MIGSTGPIFPATAHVVIPSCYSARLFMLGMPLAKKLDMERVVLPLAQWVMRNSAPILILCGLLGMLGLLLYGTLL